MATLTINGIGAELQRKLSSLAAKHGSTVSQAALRVISDALHVPPIDFVEETANSETRELQTGAQFYAQVRELVEKYGPLDVEIPPRGTSHREIPDFSRWPD